MHVWIYIPLSLQLIVCRRALSWSLLVSPRLCVPPGYIFKVAFFTNLAESIAEAPIGMI